MDTDFYFLTGLTPVKYASLLSIENLTGQAGFIGFYLLTARSRGSLETQRISVFFYAGERPAYKKLQSLRDKTRSCLDMTSFPFVIPSFFMHVLSTPRNDNTFLFENSDSVHKEL